MGFSDLCAIQPQNREDFIQLRALLPGVYVLHARVSGARAASTYRPTDSTENSAGGAVIASDAAAVRNRLLPS